MAFSSQTMGAYFLFPIYYALFQGLEGLAMIMIFRAYRRFYADDVMVPTSRITYDKFDEDLDGEGFYRGEMYQNPSQSSSSDSFYGRFNKENTTVDGPQSPPKHLPLFHKNEPAISKPPKSESFGDKTNLIPQNRLYPSGAADYGGVDK